MPFALAIYFIRDQQGCASLLRSFAARAWDCQSPDGADARMRMRNLATLAFCFAGIVTLGLALVPSQAPLLKHVNDKAQHGVAFALLTLIAWAAFPRFSSIRLFVMLAAFGGLIELLQTIALFQREADVKDWLADCAAVLIALALAAASSLRARSGPDESCPLPIALHPVCAAQMLRDARRHVALQNNQSNSRGSGDPPDVAQTMDRDIAHHVETIW